MTLAEQPCLVIVVSGDIGRYSSFPSSLVHLMKPPGSDIAWQIGLSPAAGANNALRDALHGDVVSHLTGERYPADHFQSFFILGDDHAFTPWVLARLLAHNVDIAVAMCSRRMKPIIPCLFTDDSQPGPPGEFPPVEWDMLPPPSASPFPVKIAGNAGMLLSRRVVEKMNDPWFEVGKQGSDALNEDSYFCVKAREAGFEILADHAVHYPDAQGRGVAGIGHTTPCTIWPFWDGRQWTVLMEIGGARFVFPQPPRANAPGMTLKGAT